MLSAWGIDHGGISKAVVPYSAQLGRSAPARALTSRFGQETAKIGRELRIPGMQLDGGIMAHGPQAAPARQFYASRLANKPQVKGGAMTRGMADRASMPTASGGAPSINDVINRNQAARTGSGGRPTRWAGM